MKNKLLKFSSIFGVFALCGLFCSSFLFSKKEVKEVSADSYVVLAQNLYSQQVNNDFYFNTIEGTEGNYYWQNVWACSLEMSYRVSVVEVVGSTGSLGQKIRIEISKFRYFGNTGTYSYSIFPRWSNLNDNEEFMRRGGMISYTDFLQEDCSFNLAFNIKYSEIKAHFWEGYPNTYTFYIIFELVDNVTGYVYTNSTFTNSSDNPLITADELKDVIDDTGLSFNANWANIPQTNYKVRDVVLDYSYGSEDIGYVNGYNVGFVSGYNSGSLDGYNNGYNNGYNAAMSDIELLQQQSYSGGYSAGYNAAITSNTTIATIFSNILLIGMLPVDFFLRILNFEVLGINVASFITALLSVALTVIVIRLVTGKKND